MTSGIGQFLLCFCLVAALRIFSATFPDFLHPNNIAAFCAIYCHGGVMKEVKDLGRCTFNNIFFALSLLYNLSLYAFPVQDSGREIILQRVFSLCIVFC